MAVRSRRRISGVVGIAVAALTLLLPSPAQAELSPGTEVLPISGVGVFCAADSSGSTVSVTQTVNGVTVQAGAQCSPLAARAAGLYSVDALASPTQLRFDSMCANNGGTGVTNGFAEVPSGTTVNGMPVGSTASLTDTNVAVTFPNGRTAIVNQVITTSTTVTRTAIAFTGGPIVGRVVCGRSG